MAGPPERRRGAAEGRGGRALPWDRHTTARGTARQYGTYNGSGTARQEATPLKPTQQRSDATPERSEDLGSRAREPINPGGAALHLSASLFCGPVPRREAT
jgi:hypothetical protein